MLQLLAAIPTIITAVSKVSELFKKGRDTVQEVTGEPSRASTPDELQTEVQQLPPDQQNRWAEVMAKEVDKYVAENERLAVEIGLVDANITSKISQEAASKIALMRMTTRPWAVKCMVLYVLFPFFLVIVDLVQHLILAWLPFLDRWIDPFNSFEYVFGVMKWPENVNAGTLDKLASLFSSQGGPATFAGELYMESIPWVVSIILGYMGLREVGKWKGTADEAPQIGAVGGKPSTLSVVTQTLSDGVDLVSNIRSWFKKKK
jgi:hypothetical protein